MGVGKDTVAAMLRKRLGAHRVRHTAFADEIKSICGYLFDFDPTQLYGPSQRRNDPDPRYPRPDGTCLSTRDALRAFGDAGRACYPRLWIDRTLARAAQARRLGYTHVIISDVRYVNEAAAIIDAGGQVIRVTRPVTGAAPPHGSEAEQSSPEFAAHVAHELVNDGTLEDLAAKVELLAAGLAGGVVGDGFGE